ncbi:MAG: hypothetical protein COA79_05520 [Planctomycetota bacterium]|nr:MAG: hypothetical protein COA79_05520 [Planctomycetota bacterium]
MNIEEFKLRWPYYALLLLSLLAYYQSTKNLDLLIITSVGLIVRLFIKQYFQIIKMWVPYMFMAIIFTFILKLSTEDDSMFASIRATTLSVYYFYICTITNFLRKPNTKQDTQIIVFVFAIFTFTIFSTTASSSQKWGISIPVLLNISFALMILTAIRNLPLQKNRILRRLSWFVFTLVVIHITSNLFVLYMKDAHKYFNKFLKSQRIMSSDTSSITSYDTSWFENNKDVTFIRIFSENNPVHLKSSTFNKYNKRLWNNEYVDHRKSIRKLNSIKSNGEFITRIQKSTASFNQEKNDQDKCDIVLSYLAPSVLYTQKDTIWVKTKQELSEIYANGKLKTFSGKLGYSIYQNKKPVIPSENISANYSYKKIEFGTQSDRYYISNLSHNIVGNEKSIKQKVKLIHQYLIRNFKYEITPERPPDEHINRPILHFLQTANAKEDKNKSKPAHCQYFATSSVMLLRAQDIPARYVTGFLCQRYNNFGGYWFINKIDAHAWVEYYDNGWKTFDPTKDLVITEHTKQVLGGYAAIEEFLKFKLNTWFFLFGSGHIAYVLDQWWEAFIELLGNNLYLIYIIVGISFIALIYFLIKRKRGSTNSQFLSYQKSSNKRIKELFKDLKKMEASIKKINIFRSATTTLAELKQNINLSELSNKDKQKSSAIIDELQLLLYSNPN